MSSICRSLKYASIWNQHHDHGHITDRTSTETPTSSGLSKLCFCCLAVHYKNAFVMRLRIVLLALRHDSRSLLTTLLVHTLDLGRRVQRVGPHQNAICQNKSHGKIEDVVVISTTHRQRSTVTILLTSLYSDEVYIV